MCDEIAERMNQTCAGIEEPGAMDCMHEEWHADDMSKRSATTGCRVASLNGAKKLATHEEHRDEVTALMESLEIDILVFEELEPGGTGDTSMVAVKDYMIGKDMGAEAVTRGTSSGKGGQVMLIGRKWAKLQRTVHRFNPKSADRDRVLAVEFDNKEQGHHNKLLVMGYYGYNDAQGHRAEITEMHRFIYDTKKKFKKKNPMASVVLLGDINAAQRTDLDTNAVYESGEALEGDGGLEGTEQKEPDAFVLNHLETFGLTDIIRERYPTNNFVTRRAAHQTNRFIDRMYVTSELLGNQTRAGIYQPGVFTYGGVDTDHKMVVVDLPIDCAGAAAARVELWSKHKHEKLQWDADAMGVMAEEQKKEFNEKARETAPETGATAEEVHKWLRGAAEGTVMKKVLKEYPKKARGPKHFQSDDGCIRASLGRMRETIRRTKEIRRDNNRRLKTAKQPLKKIRPCGTGPRGLEDLHKQCARENRKDIVDILEERVKEAVAYLAKSERSKRQRKIAECKKRRTDRFQHRMKKRLKQVITSIMRRAAVHEEITTSNRQEGEGIATSAQEVATEVVAFYRRWMASRVSWEDRWETWEDMIRMNVGGLKNPEDAAFVETAYKESFDKFRSLQEAEGIWDPIWDNITLQLVRETLVNLTSGTAGGPSEITYDVLKALDDDNLELIREQLQAFMDARGLPKVMNRSLLRPLPKTDAGLADLALTRPIALMEVVGKVFEKIVFDRILKVLVGHEMLDASQHGGLPGRSTAPPMHNLAEAMQDAQMSGEELHVVSMDLSKAFDSLEHWSQAMSWTALGMPKQMTEMLMRMDQEGETAVILGQGRTTADVLGEAGWFKSGRGVRQGSIGGPIKWIVYMNFWLKYVHEKHKGQGFKMSRAKPWDGELLGQMFIDDSNWFASTVENMTGIIESNETFVKFHGLSFNMKKCEYIVINQGGDEGEWKRPTWASGSILVETIRRVKDKERWKQGADDREERLTRAEEDIHRHEWDTAPTSKSAWEWLVQVDAIHDQMRGWEQRSKKRWWGQNEPPTPEDDRLEQEIRGKLEVLLDEIYDAPEGAIVERVGRRVGEWKRLVEERNRAAVEPGRSMRYLGVWYEEGFKWAHQKRVLASKFADLNTKILQSSPSREEAIYCINATINAALKYPLRVAKIDKTTLRNWDTANRKVVSKAGKLMAMHPMVYHLARSEGGLGLESLESAVGIGQVEAYMEALNTEDLNGAITRAGRRRFLTSLGGANPENGTIHAVVEEALRENGWTVTEETDNTTRLMQKTTRLNYMEASVQGVVDIAKANTRALVGATWSMYGDGATYESENRAGWGVWMTTAGDGSVGVGEERTARGRMCGMQTNDGAEAQAILQAMLMVHPGEEARYYCDNQGCVQKWERLGKESTMRWGYRAI